jgi:hypothetical protein
MRRAPRCWVGVDGEGVGRKPHRYVLLSSADTLGKTSSIEDEDGLSTKACLDFFLALPTDRKVCGYYLGYDWTMILRDLPNKSIYRLLRTELRTLPRDEGSGFSCVRWKGYRLHYLSGMMRIRHGDHSVTVWDLGKFFQAPFVDSIRDWGIKTDINAIAAMKAQRSGFERLTPEIRAYCLAECAALASLATDLEEAHVAIDLKPRAWHGPGSTASAALKRMGIESKRGDIPSGVAHAANCAFFGGRFEHSTVGRVEKVEGYDVVSAYPYQTYNLPCLEHGHWTHVTKGLGNALADARGGAIRFKVTDVGDIPWAPLPCRVKDGTIVYGRGGFTGWCWSHEWKMARRWPGVEWAGEAWVLNSECVCRPFANVLPLFRERVALGKSQRGRVLKLALNSLYGKLAQAVGVPKYGSRVWAGMITSGLRAELLNMIERHSRPENVKAVATDGLYSTELVDCSHRPLAPDLLGSWEHERHGTMVLVRPGIYWSEEDDTLRARGIGRRNLDKQRDTVLAAIEAGAERADIGTSVAFGGARACIYDPAKHKRSQYYGEWHEIPARINLTPLPKRNPDWSLRMLEGVESMPYSKGVVSDDSRALRFMADLFWGSK